MFKFSSISFHPKFVAVVDAVIGAAMLWWLRQIGSWWTAGLWLASRTFFWYLFIRFVYYPPEVNRWRHFFSLFFFNAGMLGFLLFTEWNIAWWIEGVLYIAAPLVSFWLLPSAQVGLAALFKPHRRWRFVMALTAVAGLFEVMGAVLSFQMTPSVAIRWTWMVIIALAVTILALWWWAEYGLKIFNSPPPDRSSPAAVSSSPAKAAVWWSAAFFVLMLELEWTLSLLPIGYQAGSLVLTWLWYLLWIMIRFHLSPDGINWSKQRLPLAAALLFFIVFFVFIVRWK